MFFRARRRSYLNAHTCTEESISQTGTHISGLHIQKSIYIILYLHVITYAKFSVSARLSDCMSNTFIQTTEHDDTARFVAQSSEPGAIDDDTMTAPPPSCRRRIVCPNCGPLPRRTHFAVGRGCNPKRGLVPVRFTCIRIRSVTTTQLSAYQLHAPHLCSKIKHKIQRTHPGTPGPSNTPRSAYTPAATRGAQPTTEARLAQVAILPT